MVQVVIDPTEDGGYRLIVDGHDLSDVIRAGGVSVHFAPDGTTDVLLRLQPAELRAHLPRARVLAAESYLTRGEA